MRGLYVISLLLLGLPTVLTPLPEHVEFGPQVEPVRYFYDNIGAISDEISERLALIAIVLVLQVLLLLSVILKIRKDRRKPEASDQIKTE